VARDSPGPRCTSPVVSPPRVMGSSQSIRWHCWLTETVATAALAVTLTVLQRPAGAGASSSTRRQPAATTVTRLDDGSAVMSGVAVDDELGPSRAAFYAESLFDAAHQHVLSDNENQPADQCRDRWLEPFASDSIWNTAIGSQADFVHAKLFADPGTKPRSFHNDNDLLVRTRVSDPQVEWVNQGDWSYHAGGGCALQNRSRTGHPCSSNDTQKMDGCATKIRLPYRWITATDCDGPPENNASNCRKKGDHGNNAMAVLLPDNVTLVQMQPAFRCEFGAPLFARWGNSTDGGPQNFPNETSILGLGTYGAHGGSGLSSIGGSVRLGELLPSTPPIRHALKIELNNAWYYGKTQLQPFDPPHHSGTQYVWPAIGCNSGPNPTLNSSRGYTGTNSFVAPGALLAIPRALAATLTTTTTPGEKIKRAMVDYGAYIVDGTGPAHLQVTRAALCFDSEVNAEMRSAFGYAMTAPGGVSATDTDGGAALYHDLLRIFQTLHAVTNNAPGSVGGGGTPHVPRKPPICEV
jgi:hypothetical protein